MQLGHGSRVLVTGASRGPGRSLAERIVRAGESDLPEVYHPGSTRALRLLQGLAPTIADRLMGGKAAAPRR